MRKIGILGSTGSIGVQALEVVNHLKDELKIVYLTANRNVSLLAEQVRQVKPEYICIGDESLLPELKQLLEHEPVKIFTGRTGLLELASCSEVDICLNGLVGASGMDPTIHAVNNGVDVALSNKESLVMAGRHIMNLKEKSGSVIFPVDSEHSAIWQCLAGEKMEQVRRLVLTGSGGPFRERDIDSFSTISVDEALNHPNWDMGRKITIDSATMMNKGLEVIEAHWLFDLTPDQIDIVVHPQSIIHSMVEFNDSSIKAQMGVPDMKVPIQYALTYPDHFSADWERLDFMDYNQLTFESVDTQKFPCIQLAYDALEKGPSHSVVLNVANDLTVEAFLQGKIAFTEIPELNWNAMEKHDPVENPDLDAIYALTDWTNQYIGNKI